MLILVGPLIAFAGIVALFLVLRARARATPRSMYSTAREDRARKVREARELALRSATAEAPPVAAEPAPARAAPAYQPPPATPPEPARVASVPPATPTEPAPLAVPEPEPELQPELQPVAEVEPLPLPEREPEGEPQPAWLAVPQRASASGAPASTAAVEEPEWLPSQTHPPQPRRPVAAELDEVEEPPEPRMASTIVSYVVLGASLVVILLGIAVMIGMSRG